MAEFQYYPFDTGDGSFLSESRWTDMFIWMRTVGVLSEDTTLSPTAELVVNPAASPVGLEVQVEDGEAFIQGFMFIQTDGPEVLGLQDNTSGDDRIDLVVVRLDKVNNIISYEVILGTPAMSPVAPSPVQNASIWDLPLAEVEVANGATEIFAMDITDVRVRSVQGDGGSSAVTLTSAGGDESLVAGSNAPPDLVTKGLTAGSNVSLSSDADAVTIDVTGAGSDVTLASGAGDETLVKNGTGPDLETKALSEGTGISLSADSETVTIATTTTIDNGTGDEGLVTGANPSFAVKSISAGTNISLSSDANTVTITYDTPACRLRVISGVPDLTNSSSAMIEYGVARYDPTNMWDSMTNPDRVTIATAGLYYASFNIIFEPQSTPTGNVVIRIYKNSTVIADASAYVTSSAWQRLICSTIEEFSASDYITTQWVNQSGVTIACIESDESSPALSVCRVGEN